MKSVCHECNRAVRVALIIWGLVTSGGWSAVPSAYTVTDITGWNAAQLATLPYFERFQPLQPAGATADFNPVAGNGVGMVAGQREYQGRGAFVQAGVQTDIAAWGTFYWSYWTCDSTDCHFYSGSVVYSPARDVNVFGHLAGYATLGGSSNGVNSFFAYDEHAYWHDAATGAHLDLTPTAHRAEASSINDYDEIVGFWSNSAGYHPFRWSPVAGHTDFVFATPHSYTISPAAVNNHGHAVGLVSIWSTPRQYFVFFSEIGSTVTPLPFPPNGAPDTGSVSDFNDHDVIVGEVHQAATPFETSAARWTRTAGTWTAVDLNEMLADGQGDFILDRAVALNEAGFIIATGHLDGTDTPNTHRLLLTPDLFPEPTVATLPAATITATSAVVRAKINPANLPTTWRFDYGPTAAYGQTTGSYPASGTAPLLGELPLTGLQPHTTYHVRGFASNAAGATAGKDLTFTTPWDWTSWATANVGATDPLGDGNHNGFADLLDYATDGSPQTTVVVNGNQAQFTFQHSRVADGVTLVVQVSDDLINWHDGSRYSHHTATPSNAYTTEMARHLINSDREQITVAAPATNSKLFFRLKAILDGMP